MDRSRRLKSPPVRRGAAGSASAAKRARQVPKASPVSGALNTVQEEARPELAEDGPERDEGSEAFQSEAQRFIEISQYFSSPLRKSASYLSEERLLAYPNPFRMEYKRGGVNTYHMKLCNLVLEPVYVKLYKLVPELEQLKFVNLSLSRCVRVPPGLSFTLGFVYDDVHERPAPPCQMVFVASRKATTPCYQLCQVDLLIEPLKLRH